MNKKEVFEQIRKNDRNGWNVEWWSLIRSIYRNVQDYEDIITLKDAFDEYTQDFEEQPEQLTYEEVAECVLEYKQSDLKLRLLDDIEKKELKAEIERIQKGVRK